MSTLTVVTGQDGGDFRNATGAPPVVKLDFVAALLRD
jgi:hypothetical protein